MTSIYSDEYQRLIASLAEARRAAGITQAQLAEQIGRPQSFVSKVERGERRLDVIEFYQVCRLLGADGSELIDQALFRARR